MGIKEELVKDIGSLRKQAQKKFETGDIDREKYDKINGTLNEISVLVIG